MEYAFVIFHVLADFNGLSPAIYDTFRYGNIHRIPLLSCYSFYWMSEAPHDNLVIPIAEKRSAFMVPKEFFELFLVLAAYPDALYLDIWVIWKCDKYSVPEQVTNFLSVAHYFMTLF